MNTQLLVVTLGAALAVSGCGTNAKDASLSLATGSAFTEVTLPQGTQLPLSLTSSVGSDTSAIEDVVTAELTHAVTVDGRDVLPAGARLSGAVTDVDGSGQVRGRILVAFRFTSLRTGNTRYNVETAGLSPQAPAAKAQEVRLGPGADVTTYLTVPLTVRVVRN
jgi:hypothetical protein